MVEEVAFDRHNDITGKGECSALKIKRAKNIPVTPVTLILLINNCSVLYQYTRKVTLYTDFSADGLKEINKYSQPATH